jgi:hypothetical protein
MKKKTTVNVSDLFNVGYGTKLDLKQMTIASALDANSVCFVSRSSKNLGVVARVKKLSDVQPLPAGAITVALGGSILSSFVQEYPFYTAQNIAVLTPKLEMTYEEKIFYCLCLENNIYKYSTFGREANRTLKIIELPKVQPVWLKDVNRTLEVDSSKPFSKNKYNLLHNRKWKWYGYSELFTIKKGERIVNNDLIAGSTPCIRPIEFNNGVDGYITLPPNHKGNTITISYNGSVGEAFYQHEAYFAVDDINILYPKSKLNPFIAMFLIPLIRMEKYRYSFGRKWNLTRMRKSLIKLPSKINGKPDWSFMENYIKSLPFSKSLKNT